MSFCMRVGTISAQNIRLDLISRCPCPYSMWESILYVRRWAILIMLDTLHGYFANSDPKQPFITKSYRFTQIWSKMPFVGV